MRPPGALSFLLLGLVPGLGCPARTGGGSGVATQAIGATLGDTAYLEHCRREGVPIPIRVLDSGWSNHGRIEEPSLGTFAVDGSGPFESELWSFESTNPPGICLALPRWYTSGPDAGKAEAFGVICMGKYSSTACFFDNPSGDFFWRGRSELITKYAGGQDLVQNGQVACTDCHSGASPFLIHPEKKAFAELLSDPARADLLRTASAFDQTMPTARQTPPRLNDAESINVRSGLSALPAPPISVAKGVADAAF